MKIALSLLAVIGLFCSIVCSGIAEPATVVPEIFLKGEYDRTPGAQLRLPLRVLLVPDFETIGGCQGFCKLAPRIWELKPNFILINALDLYKCRNQSELKAVLRPFVSGLTVYGLVDRKSNEQSRAAAGSPKLTDDPDGILRTCIVSVPKTTDGNTDKSKEDEQTCSPDDIKMPWSMKPPADCVYGRALVAAGFTRKSGKHGTDYIEVMPATFKRTQLVIIDVAAKDDTEKDGQVR